MRSFLTALVRNEHAVSDAEISTFMNNGDKFGTSFVINMETKPERLLEATKTLQKVGVPFTHFKAISGAKLLQHKNEYEFDMASFFSILRPGELGCVLSHLSIINLAAQHPQQDHFTLIFEDDIVTSATSIADTLARVTNIDGKESVDLLYLGKCLECCSKMTRIEDNIWRGVAPSCCHAYAIKNSFAKKVMIDIEECSFGAPNCEYFNRGIDSILGDYTINAEANTLIIHPAIFMQDVLTTTSDLRASFLHNYLECRDTVGDAPPQPQVIPGQETKGGPDWLKIALFVIVGIVIVVLLTKFISKHQKISLVITIIILFVYVVILGMYFKGKLSTSSNESNQENATMTIESFTAPNLSSPVIAQHFEIDKTHLLTKEYKAFNPNAVIKNGHIVTAFRVSNGKSSYPLVEVFDADLKLVASKRIGIKSDRKVVDYTRPLGFEDMRIFDHNGEIGLIGVNLDRNEGTLPSMVVVHLDDHFETHTVTHLNYPPVANRANKNWAPISLSDSRLGFVVSVDPLLIVTQIDETGLCGKVIEKPTHLGLAAVRNSSVTLRGEKMPAEYQKVMKITEPQDEYFMLVHTKYVESDFKKDGKLIQYQHYVAIVNPIKGTVRLSKPFHVEKAERPHIEYVSGFFFHPGGDLTITYGLEDEEAKFFPLSVKNLTILF